MKAGMIIVAVAIIAGLVYVFYHQSAANAAANANNPTRNLPFAPPSRSPNLVPLANPAAPNAAIVVGAASVAASLAAALNPGQTSAVIAPPQAPGVQAPGVDYLVLGPGTTASPAELSTALQSGWIPGVEDPGTNLAAPDYSVAAGEQGADVSYS